MRKILAVIVFALCASSAFGATRIHKTVAPSGGDYTSLETCLNDNEQNLVTGDKYLDVEITGVWTSPDTNYVVIHNYTTDKTHNINIYASGSARNNGTYSGYKLEQTGYVMAIGAFTSIDGFCVGQNITNYRNDYSAVRITAYNIVVTIKNMCMKRLSTVGSESGNNPCIDTGGPQDNTNVYIYNNIIYGFKTSGVGHDEGINTSDHAGEKNYIYNNTVYDCDIGFNIINSGLLKNNLSYNNKLADYAGTFSTSSTNNLSKDGTAPAYNVYYTTKTITFVDASAGDFHLVATDTDAIGKGTDLSSIFTTGIDGDTRTVPWDIGADMYISEPSFVPRFLRFRGKLKLQ